MSIPTALRDVAKALEALAAAYESEARQGTKEPKPKVKRTPRVYPEITAEDMAWAKIENEKRRRRLGF